MRVGEITSRQIENQAQGVGKTLVAQLEETAKSKVETLKEDIIKIVTELPEDADQKTEDAAYEKVVQEVRNAGTAIKEKAQAIRDWETKYDADTTALVNAALESTLKIIDSIRDLGLQEIGMRWANMEGVTYEDWSTYHDLKSEFDGWRNDVEDAALKHENLQIARAEGDHVRETAVREAQHAVGELVRLRDASKWKIAARDSTDDFASKAIPPKAKVDKAKSAVETSSQPPPSPLSSVSEAFEDASDDLSEAIEAATSSIAELFEDDLSLAEDLASAATSTIEEVTESLKPGAESVVSAAEEKTEQVSSAIIGTPAPPASESLSDAPSSTESVSSTVSDKASTASSKVFGGAMAAEVEAKQIIFDHDFDDDTISDEIQSTVSAADDKAAELTDAVNEALEGLTATPTEDTIESVSSVAGEKVATAISAASSVLYGTTGVVESVSSVAADEYAQAVTAYVFPSFFTGAC
jgi:hypothetical protein